MISDQEIQRCLDVLNKAPDIMGACKQRALKASHMLGYTEAIEMKRCNEQSAVAQKKMARASSSYHDALLEDALSAGQFEVEKAKVKAAETTVSVWQTQQRAFKGPRP